MNTIIYNMLNGLSTQTSFYLQSSLWRWGTPPKEAFIMPRKEEYAKMTEEQKEKHRKYNREWRKKLNSYREVKDKEYFGGMKETALKRDNYTCQDCSMTDEEHFKKWGKRISIHHKDGQGRYSKIKNNNLNNLITLCCSCHGRTDRLTELQELKKAGKCIRDSKNGQYLKQVKR